MSDNIVSHWNLDESAGVRFDDCGVNHFTSSDNAFEGEIEAVMSKPRRAYVHRLKKQKLEDFWTDEHKSEFINIFIERVDARLKMLHAGIGQDSRMVMGFESDE